MSSNEGNGKPSFHRPEPGEHVYNNSATGLGTAPTWLVPRRKGGGGGGGGGTGPAGPTGPPGSPGPAGPGVPVGGTTGQVLAKFSNADLDTFWETVVGGGIQFGITNTGSYLDVVTSGDVNFAATGDVIASGDGVTLLATGNDGLLLKTQGFGDMIIQVADPGTPPSDLRIRGIPTSFPGGGPDIVWRDASGTLRIGSPGGATGLAGFLAEEQGPMPGSLSSRGMYRVPFREAVSVTFTLDRASLHLETPGSTSSVLQVEKSSSAGVFTPVAVCSLTVTASNHQATDVTTGLGTLTSGDLVRFRWSALGTGANSYFVQLEGHE